MAEREPWYKGAWEAFSFATNVAGLLFLVDAVPFLVYLHAHRWLQFFTAFTGCLPLAMSSLALSALAFVYPPVVGRRAVQFPLNLTLPAVFTGLTAVSARV